MLWPGDVIVSTRKEKTAKAVRALTGGEFSHVEIVIDQSSRMEAVQQGITCKSPHIDKVEWTDHGYRCLERLDEYDRIAVLRHVDASRFMDAITLAFVTVQIESLGKAYPPLTALVGALRFPGPAERLLRVAASIHERPRGVAGPFCSMLVAGVFQKAGLPWTDATNDPARTTPSDFFTSPYFETVPDVITRPDPDKPHDTDFAALLGAYRYEESVAALQRRDFFRALHEGRLFDRSMMAYCREQAVAPQNEDILRRLEDVVADEERLRDCPFANGWHLIDRLDSASFVRAYVKQPFQTASRACPFECGGVAEPIGGWGLGRDLFSCGACRRLAIRWRHEDEVRRDPSTDPFAESMPQIHEILKKYVGTGKLIGEYLDLKRELRDHPPPPSFSM
jgi:hypothetical protein